MSSSQLLSSLQRTQRELIDVQRAISTGTQVSSPSAAPARTSAILLLQQQLEARTQHENNLARALGIMNTVDGALSEATNTALEAKTIASSQIGIGSDSGTRGNQALVVSEQLRALKDIANREFGGINLFGGNQVLNSAGEVFVDFLGGMRYIGSRENMTNEVGLDQPLAINSNGHDSFGALSLRVESAIDLNPAATYATRISDVNGAQGLGVRLGQVIVTVDGTQSVVDLAGAHTLDDVRIRINDAVNAVDPTAGSIDVAGSGFALTANAGHTIDVSDIGAGQIAADLGIVLTATAATVNGGDIDPRLTELTTLASLGVTADFAGGLKITQGSSTKIADFSSATTIQDLQNVVQQLHLGARMEINRDGTALNLVSEVSGLEFSVGENAGGTTATDLGLRTFGVETQLKDFRLGLGVEVSEGQDDFRIELHDGSTFDVNLDGVSTVNEAITAIANAATTAGLTVGGVGSGGTNFNIGLATDGNGFTFEDNTAGANDFQVVQLNTSLAATHLGIYQNAGAGGSIIGDDNAKVQVDSIFTHLINLHDALVNDDTAGIVFAGDGMERSIDQLARARADAGVRANRIEQEQERSQELRRLEETTLDELRGADITAVITRFAQLQQQMQASLSIGAQNLQVSFLDFLR